MNAKDNLISNIHKLFRKDPYINTVLESVGAEFNRIEKKLSALKKEYLFSSMSKEQIEKLEKLLKYKTSNSDIENQRKEIEARWKTSGKCDLKLLQAIADAWRAGTVILSFTSGTLQLGFTSEASSDYDLAGLTNSINEAKPAHLDMNFIYQEQLRANYYLLNFNTEVIEEDFN